MLQGAEEYRARPHPGWTLSLDADLSEAEGNAAELS
jgi:hypothetical protein